MFLFCNARIAFFETDAWFLQVLFGNVKKNMYLCSRKIVNTSLLYNEILYNPICHSNGSNYGYGSPDSNVAP